MGGKLVLVLPGKGVCETNSPSAFAPFLHPIVRSLEPWLWQRLAVFFGGHAASSRCFTGFQATQQTGELITWPDSTSTQDSGWPWGWHHIFLGIGNTYTYPSVATLTGWGSNIETWPARTTYINVDFQTNCSPQLLGFPILPPGIVFNISFAAVFLHGTPVRCWKFLTWRMSIKS